MYVRKEGINRKARLPDIQRMHFLTKILAFCQNLQETCRYLGTPFSSTTINCPKMS